MRISDWSSDVCSSDLADLLEGVGVDEMRDAFAYGQAALVMLALDVFRPTLRLGPFAAPLQLVDLRLPAHASSPPARSVKIRWRRPPGLRRRHRLPRRGSDRKSTRLNSSH